jgi:hypothetical protein
MKKLKKTRFSRLSAPAGAIQGVAKSSFRFEKAQKIGVFVG